MCLHIIWTALGIFFRYSWHYFLSTCARVFLSVSFEDILFTGEWIWQQQWNGHPGPHPSTLSPRPAPSCPSAHHLRGVFRGSAGCPGAVKLGVQGHRGPDVTKLCASKEGTSRWQRRIPLKGKGHFSYVRDTVTLLPIGRWHKWESQLAVTCSPPSAPSLLHTTIV